MHKILLSEPRIGSYSACLVAAFVAGYLLTRWRAVRSGIKGSHIDNLVLLIALLSLFGARFFSWLFYYPPGISLGRALTTGGGGMVFYGGLLFGMLTVVGYAGITRLRLAELIDVFAPGLALGLALGRVGCFLAGCCWGDLCVGPTQLPSGTTAWQVRTLPLISGENFPLAVTFPPGTGAYEQHRQSGLIEAGAHHSKPVHPVQIYEAGLVFCLALGLHLGWARRRWSGQVCCMLLLGYAMIRFGTEFLRADNRPLYLGLTLSQVISLALAGLALLVWLRCRSVAAERTKVGGRWVDAVPLYR